MGHRAFGAVGDLGLSMFWSLGQVGLRTVGTKGPFEALGHMAYMGFSTFGVLCTFTVLYYSILCHTIPYYAILFHTMPFYAILFYGTMPYYSINRDTRNFY